MIKKLQYDFFTTNELKPQGWLKKQLEIQASGLCGNLDKVWPDVRDSKWIGGDCEGWERVPYWLDGFIPLAYLLDDKNMIARAKKYIDAIISFQDESGWICPCKPEERRNYDTWAVLLITKVLCLYADCSGDEQIVGVVENCLKNFSNHLNNASLRNWGSARWFEGFISIHWLYEKTHEEWLLLLAKKLRLEGTDWREVFKSGFLDESTTKWEYFSHIVNIAMALKSEALYSLFSDIEPEEFADMALSYLDKKHGLAIGHFSGDEQLSGNSPIQGTELCSIVELMYSYEYLFAVSGNPKWLDRLEALGFNSLPATISPDMWSHQYDQMINQVACYPMSKQPFRTNDRFAHTFGLEPNFGCCTANFGQGWPKLALSTFMKSEKGIASCALSPSSVTTEINGVHVHCELDTEYPFRDTLTYKITSSLPVTFTFSIRIPAVAVSATINGVSYEPGRFAEITKEWNGSETLTVNLKFKTEIISRPRNMICIRRGPLFYSLPIEARWESVEYTSNGVERKFPYCDYYIYPESKWNYALADDIFSVTECPFDCAFDMKNPPIYITAKMREIKWGFSNGHCDITPKSTEPIGPVESLKLIPYGCTILRMTEIPYIK